MEWITCGRNLWTVLLVIRLQTSSPSKSGHFGYLPMGRCLVFCGVITTRMLFFCEKHSRKIDFLAFWKDADPDIPILKQAKAEKRAIAVINLVCNPLS